MHRKWINVKVAKWKLSTFDKQSPLWLWFLPEYDWLWCWVVGRVIQSYLQSKTFHILLDILSGCITVGSSLLRSEHRIQLLRMYHVFISFCAILLQSSMTKPLCNGISWQSQQRVRITRVLPLTVPTQPALRAINAFTRNSIPKAAGLCGAWKTYFYGIRSEFRWCGYVESDTISISGSIRNKTHGQFTQTVCAVRR